jgi:type I restriction enzyme S subunit
MDLISGPTLSEDCEAPKDWLKYTIGDLIEFEGGSQPDKVFFRPSWRPGYVRLIQIRDYKTNKYETFVPASLARRFCNTNDIMIGRYGPPIFQILRGIEGAYNVALIKAKPRPQINHLYAYYYLQQQKLFTFVEKLSQRSSGQTGVDLTELRNYPLPLPPDTAEQAAIATALSDMDALIESLDQVLAKKRHLKHGALQELLRPKDGWLEKRLGSTSVCKARIGWQGLTTAEYLDTGDFCLVTGTDFRNGYIDWDNCHYVAKVRYKQDENIQLRSRDVLVTKDGTIGKVAFVDRLHKPATLNSGVFVIRPIEDAFDPAFFYYVLCSNVFTDFLGQLSAGSTINHLYQKDFVNFVYNTPGTLNQQSAIAAILSDMDAEIAALETKLAKARQIKQGMMQNLLTGRIRLV